MRSYVNTIIFESALDSVAPSNSLVYSVIKRLLSPSIKIIEEDCDTLLGEFVSISTRAQGLIELETNNPLTSARMSSLITANNKEVAVRSTATCTSIGGVCKKCLRGSRPGLVIPETGSLYVLDPEVIVDTGPIGIETGQTSATLKYPKSQFDKVYVYNDGILVDPSTYTLTETSLVLSSPAVSNVNYFIKYVSKTYAPYFYWLANTYSGSLLGINPLGKQLLPIRKNTMELYIPQEDIEVLVRRLKTLDIKDEDSILYIDEITDPVEKALYVVVLSSIFLNT